MAFPDIASRESSRWSVWVFAATAAACGGQVGSATDGLGGIVVDPATSGSAGGTAGSRGNGGSGGYAGTGDPTGTAGAGTGAGGTGVSGESCVLPWFGSLKGVKGLLSCPAHDDPAFLTYGQTKYDFCTKFTGPIGSRYVGENLSCCYTMDLTACGNSYVGDGCSELWYFGDGVTTTTIPDKPVGNAFDECTVPFGTPIVLNTQAERAGHLIGVWLKCRGEHPWFAGNGFVFRADGTYHSLQTDSQGRLVETTECDQSGLWGFIPNANQLNMSTGHTYNYYFPRFVDGARRHLQMEGMAGPLEFVSFE